MFQISDVSLFQISLPSGTKVVEFAWELYQCIDLFEIWPPLISINLFS